MVVAVLLLTFGSIADGKVRYALMSNLQMHLIKCIDMFSTCTAAVVVVTSTHRHSCTAEHYSNLETNVGAPFCALAAVRDLMHGVWCFRFLFSFRLFVAVSFLFGLTHFALLTTSGRQGAEPGGDEDDHRVGEARGRRAEGVPFYHLFSILWGVAVRRGMGDTFGGLAGANDRAELHPQGADAKVGSLQIAPFPTPTPTPTQGMYLSCFLPPKRRLPSP